MPENCIWEKICNGFLPRLIRPFFFLREMRRANHLISAKAHETGGGKNGH
jgi:hypothetical protein